MALQVCVLLLGGALASIDSTPYHQVPPALYDYISYDNSGGQTLIRGQYSVRLPDGRTQVVKYTADESGYHPLVNYTGRAAYYAPHGYEFAREPYEYEPPVSPYEPPVPPYESQIPPYEPPVPPYEPPIPPYEPPVPPYESPITPYEPPIPLHKPIIPHEPPIPPYGPPIPLHRPTIPYEPPIPPYEPPIPPYEPPMQLHRPITTYDPQTPPHKPPIQPYEPLYVEENPLTPAVAPPPVTSRDRTSPPTTSASPKTHHESSGRPAAPTAAPLSFKSTPASYKALYIPDVRPHRGLLPYPAFQPSPVRKIGGVYFPQPTYIPHY